MQVSLRSRLTAWYALLLVLTMAVFCGAILWLHWQLSLRAFDDGLRSISATASNLVEEELGESRDLSRAASEMAEVVRTPDGVVQVLDAAGAPMLRTTRPMPIPSIAQDARSTRWMETLTAEDSRRWRVSVRHGARGQQGYFVVVGAPLEEALEQWRTLLQACLIGVPLALALAIGGGLWLAQHGLRPLIAMAAEAQAITSTTPERRLTVPAAASELEQLAHSFNRVLNSLATALSTQRRFMADASHELRTPVSIMRTAADVTLNQSSRDEAEYREALAVVSQQSSRLTHLVDDMLVLARADGGGYRVVMAPLDLTALVDECMHDLEVRAEDSGIAMRSKLQSVSLRGDEALLRRMLSNLLANAITYTPRGGCITVSLEGSNGQATLEVADTGPGIPPEDRERVFERFVRLDAARGSGGAGLGLAIARWVAEAHGGAIRILSSGSGGSVFSVNLPA